jgi:hypothetical protein
VSTRSISTLPAAAISPFRNMPGTNAQAVAEMTLMLAMPPMLQAIGAHVVYASWLAATAGACLPASRCRRVI